MDERTTAVPVERTGTRPLARIGLVGAAAAAIVAVAMLAAGATASPNQTLAAGPTVSTSGKIDLAVGGPQAGRMGGRFGGMQGFGGITITAMSGSNISLETADRWTRTIVVDSGTTYVRSGESISRSDLAIGDEIRFQQTRETNGAFTIDQVAVIPPHAGGSVTAISGSTITVERPDGVTATIRVTAATTYRVGGDDDAALTDIKVGMHLVAEGTENSDGSLTANAVRAADPDSMPGPGGRGFRGPGGHGPWDDGATPDASADSAG